MSFFSRLFGRADPTGITPNANPAGVPASVGGADWSPGDPEGFTVEGDIPEPRSLPGLWPSPWDGWPAEWALPAWGDSKLTELVDTAWACLDLNSSVVSAMPVYKTRGGKVVSSEDWMTNPDPNVYASWAEFAKQLFWDYQMGEAFVIASDYYSTGWPMHFQVVPPWAVRVTVDGTRRRYFIGHIERDDVLHIRYKSTISDARGVGPLECAGARMVAAGLLVKYMTQLVEGGGVPHYILESEDSLTADEAEDLLQQWWKSRTRNLGKPPVFSGGVTAKPMQLSPADLAMTELAQWNESRIAVLLGTPPPLVGLPPAGDSMTYSNISSWFDFHDRSSLRPKTNAVMSAMSFWSLPRGCAVELNRDEYTRPAFAERAEAYAKLAAIGAISVEEIRTMERLTGDAPTVAPAALTGDAPAPAAITGGDDDS